MYSQIWAKPGLLIRRSYNMKENLKAFLRKPWVFPVLLVILGLFLLFHPGTMLNTVVRLIGAALLIGGLNGVISWLQRRNDAGVSYLDVIGGALGLLAGLLILINPESLVSLFPTLIGIAMILYGLLNLLKSYVQKKSGFDQWYISLLMALVIVVFGIILIAHPFSAAEVLARVLGVFLIYNGLSSLWIATR